MLTPGTLLRRKWIQQQPPPDYFIQYSIDKNVINPALNNKLFNKDDNILVIDHLKHPWMLDTFMYRIWVNGEEAFIEDSILERKEYYEIVK